MLRPQMVGWYGQGNHVISPISRPQLTGHTASACHREPGESQGVSWSASEVHLSHNMDPIVPYIGSAPVPP